MSAFVAGSTGRRNTTPPELCGAALEQFSHERQYLKTSPLFPEHSGDVRAHWPLSQRFRSSAFCFGVSHVLACPLYAYGSDVPA